MSLCEIENRFSNVVRWNVLKIGSQPLSALRIQIAGCLEAIALECRVQLSSSQDFGEPIFEPTIQMSYDEISANEIDRLLGYAGISAANAPIGLDADILPRIHGSDPTTQVLLFPLTGLEAHLTREEPAIAQRVQELGSMDGFVMERGDTMTAVEYLTAGIFACINFCKAKRQALTITW